MESIVIRIGAATGGGYPVSYRIPGADGVDAPLGQLPEPLSAPNGGELRQWIAGKLAQRWDFAQIGEHLRGLLGAERWPGELLKCADCNRSLPDDHLNVVFDIEPADVRSLPWELLLRRDGEHAFKTFGHHCLRATGSRDGLNGFDEARPVALPIKVLIIVGCRTDDILAEREIRSVYQAVGRFHDLWQIRVVHTPEKAQVEALVKQEKPHILHFIGHAAKRERTAGEIMADKDWWLGAGEIKRLYRNNRERPRLFLLNFCDSASIIPELQTGVAGNGSVIGMQADIKSVGAACFSEAFYNRLVEGDGISRATYQGRDALVALGGPNSEWPLPVVDIAPAGDGVMGNLLELNSRWQRFHTSVHPSLGRFDELRTLSLRAPLTWVRGVDQAGKSYLVQKHMLHSRLLGELTVSLDLGSGDKTLAQREVLAKACLRVYGQVLSQLQDERAPATPDSPIKRALNKMTELRADLDLGLIPIEEAYDSFIAYLDAIADETGRRLVFVFDGLERIMVENMSFDEVILRHHKDNGLTYSCRLIAVAADGPGTCDPAKAADPTEPCPSERNYGQVTVVELGSYPTEDYIDIGKEACRRFGLEGDQIMARLAEMQRERSPLLPPNVLQLVRSAR